jgi:serine/threonine protein kinase
MRKPPISLPARYGTPTRVFAGGQGSVFVCRDSYLDRDVAIKFLRPGGDKGALIKEVQALSSIRSKHVVQLYNVLTDENDDDVGIVLEYVPGGDLSQFQSADMIANLRVLYQLSCGIADIHANGLIHRDVKPKNAKFDDDGILKLFDFSLSCAADDAETTAVRGTREYRPPEFFDTPPVAFTESVDVYAFGVAAWQLTEQSLRSELRDAPPRPAPSFGTCTVQFPNEVVQILDATLDHNPANRPKMHQVRATLARHLLFGKHNGTITDWPNTLAINKTGQSVRISQGVVGSGVITYDGLDFILSQVTGDVYVNGTKATGNSALPQSCVIIIGAPDLGASRKFATFDVSHPEVVI